MSIAVFGWRLALGSRVGARAEGSDCGVAGVQVEEKQRQMGLGLGTGNWSWELKRTMDRGHFCIFSNGIWKSCRRQRGSDEGGKAEKKARRAGEEEESGKRRGGGGDREGGVGGSRGARAVGWGLGLGAGGSGIASFQL